LSILQQNSQLVRKLAKEHGFDFVGLAKAERLNEEADRLEKWLNNGYQGSMSYLENHFEKRVDPTKLVPGAKSVISLLYNYHNPDHDLNQKAPKLSSYAYGEDYHYVIKKKLKSLLAQIQNRIGEISGRCFVDSAPVLEREWAKRSGLGWIGKNTLLIHPKAGSYYFLAELILDLELAPDQGIRDHCGTCTRCIDACPTDAISDQGYIIDASRCISYLTIELRDAIPEEFSGQMEGWIFGCDICQEVCPWNRFATKHHEPLFEPNEELKSMTSEQWVELTEEVFKKTFKKSPVKRTKFSGLKRNLAFIDHRT
jgi:epoxyqueuosine reductase